MVVDITKYLSVEALKVLWTSRTADRLFYDAGLGNDDNGRTEQEITWDGYELLTNSKYRGKDK